MAKLIALIMLFTLSFAAEGSIRMVGSGSVYPLASLIAQQFSSKYNYATPVVEANGTGNGFKLFCAPFSNSSPSVSSASRQIKQGEMKLCNNNQAGEILEINLGLDGLTVLYPAVLGNINLTKEDIFLAFAKYVPDSKGKLIANPNKTWQDINVNLPNIALKILGPSSGSGTRDAFFEIIMHSACNNLYSAGTIKDKKIDKDVVCGSLRSDGAWIDGGETYALSVKKVMDSKDTFAIVGYNFYNAQEKKIKAASINGIALNEANLTNRTYPLLRPFYMYFKLDDVAYVVGLKELIKEATSFEAIGPKGYLKASGLIPLSNADIKAQQDKVNAKL